MVLHVFDLSPPPPQLEKSVLPAARPQSILSRAVNFGFYRNGRFIERAHPPSGVYGKNVDVFYSSCVIALVYV